ncbi:MAG: cation:proton antiporter [Gammaproteobacteria bacterium]|nr:cation:proton antiporter [Gammaproteobacteria bacterium]
MDSISIIYLLCLIFSGAAILATVSLSLGQSLIISYIVLGVLIGPYGFSFIEDPTLVQNISNVGIIFLLFLLGLNLHPQELFRMASETFLVTGVSSLVLWIIGFGFGSLMGYEFLESMLIGASLIFSSTIIGLKLIPTTMLHHQRTGEVIISVLLFQDILAIILLLVLDGTSEAGFDFLVLGRSLIAFPLLILFTYLLEKYFLIRLIAKFDRIQEYIFLLAIGWCLGIAQIAEHFGLSYEIGAFVAGVSIARSPIALFIAEHLKPLRDFFLIIFFVALGANFNISILEKIWLPALGLTLISITIKPWLFRQLLRTSHESSGRATEVGMRLGQMSEFSLLLAVIATEMTLIRAEVNYLIQVATMASFIFSSWYVVRRYPTPIATDDKLRRD